MNMVCPEKPSSRLADDTPQPGVQTRSRNLVRILGIMLSAILLTGTPVTFSPGAETAKPAIVAPANGIVEVKTTTIDGRRYCYLDEGTGWVVVLIHGAFLAENVWDKQIPVLVEAGYRVVCPHRAGMGGSQITGPMSKAKDVIDIWALLDVLKIWNCVVGGHSSGAAHTLQMLLERPQSIEAVVLVDGPGGRAPDGPSGRDGDYFLAKQARKLGPERMTETARTLYDKRKQTFAELGLPWVYHSEFDLQDYRQWAKMKSDQAFVQKLRRRPDSRNIPLRNLVRFQVPLLVFASGWGKIRQQDPEAIALQKSLPAQDATLCVITESGHWVQRRQPKEVNRQLLDFLSKKVWKQENR